MGLDLTRGGDGMNSTLNIALDNLTLAFQPIVRIVNEDTFEISDYEVLLRSKDKKTLPAAIFEKIVNNESCNQMFWEWFTLEIKKVLTDKKVRVDINIDPHQFLYQSTWDFLDKMVEYNQQITIEITERVSQELNLKKGLIDTVKHIKDLGYRVALDDISSGQYSFKVVQENIKGIDRVKLSLLIFNDDSTDSKTKNLFIMSWINFAKTNNVELVIEGIEDNIAAKEMLCHNIKLQQGFFWQVPQDYISPKEVHSFKEFE